MKKIIHSALFTATFISSLSASATCVVYADRIQQRQQQQAQGYRVPSFPDVIREETADLDHCISILNLLHHEVANADDHCAYRAVKMNFDYYGVPLTSIKSLQQCQQQQQPQQRQQPMEMQQQQSGHQQQQMPLMDRTIQNTDKAQ